MALLQRAWRSMGKIEGDEPTWIVPTIEEGGRLRHLFFDVGGDQLVAFLEPQGVPGIPTDYDAGINRGLGVPAGFYHFAFEAGSPAALVQKRDELRAKGIEVTDIVDHQWAQSIYFKDPNGLSLEYCCVVGNRPERCPQYGLSSE